MIAYVNSGIISSAILAGIPKECLELTLEQHSAQNTGIIHHFTQLIMEGIYEEFWNKDMHELLEGFLRLIYSDMCWRLFVVSIIAGVPEGALDKCLGKLLLWYLVEIKGEHSLRSYFSMGNLQSNLQMKLWSISLINPFKFLKHTSLKTGRKVKLADAKVSFLHF